MRVMKMSSLLERCGGVLEEERLCDKNGVVFGHQEREKRKHR